jgi:hypothetical protein
MNLNPTSNAKIIPLTTPNNPESQIKSAFHAAGIATAIYLGHKQKGLPPVYFEICINQLATITGQPINNHKENHNAWLAQVEGGMLITQIPESIAAATEHLNDIEKLTYQRVFETDIINLFAGAIAEANYVALQDGEVISPRLVNIAALHHYCPKPELDDLHQRLGCIDKTHQDKKISILYLQAFKLVTDPANWQAIETLSKHLLTTSKPIVHYEEIVATLERLDVNKYMFMRIN